MVAYYLSNFIRDISYSFGKKVIDVLDLEDSHQDWDIKKSIKKTGIKILHHSKDDETVIDMAFEATKKILDNLSKNEIPDTLIFCTQTPSFSIPHCSAILQDKLDLPTSTKCFDLNLGCSGYTYGLSVAYSMITSNISHRVLLVTADTYSKIINKNDKTSYLLFSDAASCSLLEKSNNVMPFTFGTDGSSFDSIIYPMSGSNMKTKNTNFSNCLLNSNGCFEMNGYSVYLFSINIVANNIKKFMEENEITIEDIDLFVLHQASLFVLETIQQKLNIPNDKMLIDIEDVGNTSSSSIPIALKRAENKQILKKHDTVLLFGFGIGLSWSGTIMKY